VKRSADLKRGAAGVFPAAALRPRTPWGAFKRMRSS